MLKSVIIGIICMVLWYGIYIVASQLVKIPQKPNRDDSVIVVQSSDELAYMEAQGFICGRSMVTPSQYECR